MGYTGLPCPCFSTSTIRRCAYFGNRSAI